MGGNALKQQGVNTVRVDTKTFNEYYEEISTIVKEQLGVETYCVKAYHTKETHGDLDILLKIDHEFHNKGINLVTWIQETFNPKAINNNNVISWEYNDFQIDFIPTKESIWDMSPFFFDYSPFGNLAGKVSHKMLCKFGWDGLVFPFRNFNGRQSHNITVSTDPRKVFEFLGFDFDKYLEGFETEQDIFDFVTNGKYFCSSNFQLENLRHIDRKRNAKRPDYNRFMAHINDNGIDSNFEFLPKDDYLPIIIEKFPEADLQNKIDELERKDNQNQILATKFNGKIVMGIYPNLKGETLGVVMYNFKESLGEWKDMFMYMDTDEIMDEFDVYLLNTVK